MLMIGCGVSVAAPANERIGRNYDDMAPGLSQYVHDAIIANCQRAADAQSTSVASREARGGHA